VIILISCAGRLQLRVVEVHKALFCTSCEECRGFSLQANIGVTQATVPMRPTQLNSRPVSPRGRLPVLQQILVGFQFQTANQSASGHFPRCRLFILNLQSQIN
jgi:hypothetical protein